MPIGGAIQIFGQEMFETEAQPQHNVGTLAVAADGIRLFRYAKCGATDITAGYLQVGPARKTNHDNCAATVAQVKGDREITIQLGATLAAVSEYAQGFLLGNDVAPEGIGIQIANHPAADSGATLKLKLAQELPEAVTTDSEFCLQHHHYMLVDEAADEERLPAGVPLVDVDTSVAPYVWLQTRGPAAVLAHDGTCTVNSICASDDANAGSVMSINDEYNAALLLRQVGIFLATGVSGEFRPVFLTID